MPSSSFDPWRTRPSLLIRVRDSADQEAWKEFHDLYAPMIRGWCRHWFPRELDDMVQDVLIRLVRCLKAFEYKPEEGRFRGYLKTVTKRLMSDLKKRPAPPPVIDDEAMLSEIEARQDLVDRLEAMFDLERLEMARQQVRDRVEERTWLAYVGTAEEGREPTEVARELGMKVGALYQAKCAVKLQLRQEIEKSQDSI